MDIAVTGSSGFIGSILVEKLLLSDHNVIKIDLDNGIDLTKVDDVNKITKFDIVFHLAAKIFVPDSFINPQSFYYTNILSTLNILELCKKYNSKLIYISSYVYGVPQYQPIDEKHPTSAFNPYTQSKLICEKLCEGYNRDFNQNILIVRPFNIYGPGQGENMLFNTIIHQAKTGKIELKDPRPKRDYIHVNDLVDLLMKCISYKNNNYDIFNAGYGKSYSVREIVDMVLTKLDFPVTINYTNEYRKNEVLDTIADITKANNYLGWQPKYDLNTGLNDLIKS